ncbi:MAG: hypothetical protein A2W31_11925 [Planctomycetes bacterium RBG_16_64_10]|nr:MAG: hypothetical protein A2W31_11925 [Planctomycetes bacterium RBG_16_64_10]
MIRISLISCILLLMIAVPASRASLLVEATVTPLVGSFQYDFSIENTGPDDVVIVSIVDAPLADPIIDPTLVTPVGFFGSYDSGLGVVDFLEDTELFAAGTTTGGFSFQSLSGPSNSFTVFEALTPLGGFITGSVNQTVVPEPAALTICCALGLAVVATWRHSKRNSHVLCRCRMRGQIRSLNFA